MIKRHKTVNKQKNLLKWFTSQVLKPKHRTQQDGIPKGCFIFT